MGTAAPLQHGTGSCPNSGALAAPPCCPELSVTSVAPPHDTPGLASIPEAIAAIARGEMVVVVDDADRENEGDLVMAAEHVTPEAVNFMVTHGRGLVCLPMTGARLDELVIRQMVPEAGQAETAFTVSIDLDEPGNTGISAVDRARCIRRAVAPDARPDDFRRPGHVFPLRARDGGVLERPGHTEAAVDLARLAGCAPAGVICEVMNADGTMARLSSLLDIAAEHGLLVVTIADLIEHRRRHERHVRRLAEAPIPTQVGVFTAIGYESGLDGRQHVALVYGDPTRSSARAAAPLVRVHSECLTGDVFGSLRCDCGGQLTESMRRIAEAGAGVVVYLRGHEGRGIGLMAKLQAYGLQDAGADTVEANVELGFPADARDYATGAQILSDLGVGAVRLLTNNPAKTAQLSQYGVEVVEQIPVEETPGPHNLRYLRAKREKMGHTLTVVEADA